MIPVDFELGRQYQLERAQEATNHRLAREAARTRYSRVTRRLHISTAKLLIAWINDVMGVTARSAEKRFERSITTGL